LDQPDVADGRSEPVALRLDDVGASTKRYEVYSERSWRVGPWRVQGNWLFLKYVPAFRGWGPYREMRAEEWKAVLDLLEQHDARLTVAVTATWVDSEDSLIPFPERFPDQAAVLKEGVERGLVEVANHGLTHCVVEKNAFRPKLFTSNRRFHREFWEWVPTPVHEEHICRSQDILQSWLDRAIVTFVPPGNVFTNATLDIAASYGLRCVSCRTKACTHGDMVVIGDERVIPFHDRDLVVNGPEWLGHLLVSQSGKRLCFVRDLAGLPAPEDA